MMDWIRHFKYDEDSPTCLVWVRDCRSGKNHQIIHISAGSPAGHLVFNDLGLPLYIDIRVGGKTFKGGRVVWELFNGVIQDKMVIDHIDGNPHNNKISNLSCKTIAGNARNRKLPLNNTSGKVGVHWLKTKTDMRAMVRWNDLDGNRKSKSFSVKSVGEELAFKLACEYRDKILVELNSNGAGYTERHGNE